MSSPSPESTPVSENPPQQPPVQASDKELNNVWFKTSMQKGRMIATTEEECQHKLDTMLKFTQAANIAGSWGKLDRSNRHVRLLEFAQEYSAENGLSAEEYEQLLQFFDDCLDRNRLSRVKDVVCDKASGKIRTIPGLTFNRSTNRFTLKVSVPVPTQTQRAPRSSGPSGSRKNAQNHA